MNPKFTIGSQVEVIDANGGIIGIGRVANIAANVTPTGKAFFYHIWLVGVRDMTVPEAQLRAFPNAG